MTYAQAQLRQASCAVANSKLVEYRRQVWRLAILVQQGVIDKSVAIDHLYEIAIAHALVRALGEDRVAAILDEAFVACEVTQTLPTAEVA